MTRFTLITLNVLFVTALVLPAQNAAMTLHGAPLVDGVYETEATAPVVLFAEFSDATLEFAIFACLATDEGGMDWSQAGILVDGAWEGNTLVLETYVPKELAGLSICLVAVARGVDGETSASPELRIHVAAPSAPLPADQQNLTANYPDTDFDSSALDDEDAANANGNVAARPAPRPASPDTLHRRSRRDARR